MQSRPFNARAMVVEHPERDLVATLLHSAIADSRRWCPPLRHNANVWLRAGETWPSGSRWAVESLGWSYEAVMERLKLTDPTHADWKKWHGLGKATKERYEARAIVEIIRVGNLTGGGSKPILGDD